MIPDDDPFDDGDFPPLILDSPASWATESGSTSPQMTIRAFEVPDQLPRVAAERPSTSAGEGVGDDLSPRTTQERSWARVTRSGRSREPAPANSVKRQRIAPGAMRGALLTRGLSYEEKIVCLEELIANVDSTVSDFLSRTGERIPSANLAQLKIFRRTRCTRRSVPAWLHKFLLTRGSATEADYPSLTAGAIAISPADASGLDRIPYTVPMWMEFCIRPLLIHDGPSEDIVQSEPRWAGDSMRLSSRQFKALLVAEIELIRSACGATAAPDPEIESRSRTATTSVMTTMRTTTTIAPKSEPQSGDPNFIGMKRAVLERLIDRPDGKLTYLVSAVRSRFPDFNRKQIIRYYCSVLSSDRAGEWLHEYLLKRRAVKWDAAMATELRTLYPIEITKLRWGLVRSVGLWIKYCIAPLLKRGRDGNPPCHFEMKGEHRYFRLSLPQRRALYAEELAWVDKDGGYPLPILDNAPHPAVSSSSSSDDDDDDEDGDEDESLPATGLSNKDKRRCLTEMIAYPRITLRELEPLLRAATSTADLSSIRAYFRQLSEMGQVPEQVHQLLMNGTTRSASIGRDRLLDEAELLFATWYGSTRAAGRKRASGWLKFAVEPLTTNASYEAFTVHPFTGRPTLYRLCDGPFKALLEGELAALTTHSLSTTVAPKRRRLKASKGLSVEDRRIALGILIANPTISRVELRQRVTKLSPQVPKRMLMSYCSNLSIRSRVPHFLHEFLLSRKAVDVTESLVADLVRLSQGRLATLHGGLTANVRSWIKYCIAPLLAAPSRKGNSSDAPCAIDGSDGGNMVRLYPLSVKSCMQICSPLWRSRSPHHEARSF